MACAQHHSRRRQSLVARAEAEAAAPSAEATAEEAEAAEEEAPAVEAPQLTPLETARALLEEADCGTLDVDALEAAFTNLDEELTELRSKVAATESAAAAAEGMAASARDQLVRLSADFDNYRRRMADEKTQLSTKIKGDVVLDLLPLVDNFELARTQVKAETEGEIKINNSYQGLYKQMVEILKALGLEPVATVDTQFDPEIHEAIMREPSDEVADGTVLMEFRKGFRLGERLLRPAMVKVSYNDAPVDATPAETVETTASETEE